jgi:hypothetical protein
MSGSWFSGKLSEQLLRTVAVTAASAITDIQRRMLTFPVPSITPASSLPPTRAQVSAPMAVEN